MQQDMRKLAEKLLTLNLEWSCVGERWYRKTYKTVDCHIEDTHRNGVKLSVVTEDGITIYTHASGFSDPILELWQTVHGRSTGEVSKTMLLRDLLDE